jgi:hypothetical protein
MTKDLAQLVLVGLFWLTVLLVLYLGATGQLHGALKEGTPTS